MERITRFRAWLLIGIVVAILSIYSIKLYSMQVADADVNGNNVTTYTIRTRVRADRGDILDINGNKLEESYLTGDAVATTYREDLTNYFHLEENE